MDHHIEKKRCKHGADRQQHNLEKACSSIIPNTNERTRKRNIQEYHNLKRGNHTSLSLSTAKREIKSSVQTNLCLAGTATRFIVLVLVLLSLSDIVQVASASTTLSTTAAFLAGPRSSTVSSLLTMTTTNDNNGATMANQHHPFCDLPGDPSLMLTTNVDLGDKKMEVMKACSKAVAAHTGKPEEYVAVSITDKASVIFGGSDAPTCLGCLYSIGAIAKESNGAIMKDVTDLLEPFGVAEDRMYITFFDVPRENVGWSRKTFAG